MDELRIQYVTASDGVSIAFADLADGYPIVYLGGMPFNHIQLVWRLAQYRAWLEQVYMRRRLVMFDARGSGLSDRGVKELSLEGYGRDIDAVADRLQLQKFAIAAVQASVTVAVDYAVCNPDRVSHLFLWDAIPDGRAYMELPQVKAFFSMLEFDWQMFTSTVARASSGWDNPDASQYEVLMRESVTQEDARLFYFGFLAGTDVTPLLPQVTQPTLVAHHKGNLMPSPETGRLVASRIAHSELLLLDGTWRDYAQNVPVVNSALDRLLGPQAPPHDVASPAAAPSSVAGGMVTILFTDIEGSTSLTQQVGDEAAQAVVRDHNAIVREALRQFGGSETKHTGDGIMASFPLASSAIEAAIAIQRGVLAHSEVHPDTAFRVRIGLNAGEPVREEQDMFGTAVQLARRVCDQASPGTILVTDVVRQLAAGKGYLFSDTGETTLRGFEEPVRLYEVRWA